MNINNKKNIRKVLSSFKYSTHGSLTSNKLSLGFLPSFKYGGLTSNNKLTSGFLSSFKYSTHGSLTSDKLNLGFSKKINILNFRNRYFSTKMFLGDLSNYDYLIKLSNKELKIILQENNLKFISKMTKKQMVEKIKNHFIALKSPTVDLPFEPID